MTGSIIGDVWGDIQLSSALQSMVDGVGAQVVELLPIGIGIMFVLAIPRVIKRVINVFI